MGGARRRVDAKRKAGSRRRKRLREKVSPLRSQSQNIVVPRAMKQQKKTKRRPASPAKEGTKAQPVASSLDFARLKPSATLANLPPVSLEDPSRRVTVRKRGVQRTARSSRRVHRPVAGFSGVDVSKLRFSMGGEPTPLKPEPAAPLSPILPPPQPHEHLLVQPRSPPAAAPLDLLDAAELQPALEQLDNQPELARAPNLTVHIHAQTVNMAPRAAVAGDKQAQPSLLAAAQEPLAPRFALMHQSQAPAAVSRFPTEAELVMLPQAPPLALPAEDDPQSPH